MGILDRLTPLGSRRRLYSPDQEPPIARPGPAPVRGRGEEMAPPPPGEATGDGSLPDPAQPPQPRGRWEDAALVNVRVSELVKRQIGMGGGMPGHDRTRPQEK